MINKRDMRYTTFKKKKKPTHPPTNKKKQKPPNPKPHKKNQNKPQPPTPQPKKNPPKKPKKKTSLLYNLKKKLTRWGKSGLLEVQFGQREMGIQWGRTHVEGEVDRKRGQIRKIKEKTQIVRGEAGMTVKILITKRSCSVQPE